MAALCRLQSVLLSPLSSPPSFSFSSSAPLSQCAADNGMIYAASSVLELGLPHQFSFAFYFFLVDLMFRVNDQCESTDAINTTPSIFCDIILIIEREIVFLMARLYKQVRAQATASQLPVGIKRLAQGHFGWELRLCGWKTLTLCHPV